MRKNSGGPASIHRTVAGWPAPSMADDERFCEWLDMFVVDDAGAFVDAVEEFLTGQRTVRKVDQILAAILFTDIAGSTARGAGRDQRCRNLPDDHNALAQKTIAASAGVDIG